MEETSSVILVVAECLVADARRLHLHSLLLILLAFSQAFHSASYFVLQDASEIWNPLNSLIKSAGRENGIEEEEIVFLGGAGRKVSEVALDIGPFGSSEFLRESYCLLASKHTWPRVHRRKL